MIHVYYKTFKKNKIDIHGILFGCLKIQLQNTVVSFLFYINKYIGIYLQKVPEDYFEDESLRIFTFDFILFLLCLNFLAILYTFESEKTKVLKNIIDNNNNMLL